MDASALTAAVARNLRSLRREREWTLDALASRSGVSKGMIVQVEQGQTNPSIQTLWRLASALGVGLAGILAFDSEPPLRIVRGAEAARLWEGEHGGVGDFLVGGEQPVRTELWDWTLEPGDGHDGQVHPRATREMLYVLEGEITLTLDKSTRTPLAAPAAAVYLADRPHLIENRSRRSARLIMVLVEGHGS